MRLYARCAEHNRSLEGKLWINSGGKIELVDMLCVDPDSRHTVWGCEDSWKIRVVTEGSESCRHLMITKRGNCTATSCWNSIYKQTREKETVEGFPGEKY